MADYGGYKMAKQLMMEHNNNVLLVDGLNLAFRWKHKKSQFFKEEYINTIISLSNSYKCSKIIVAVDKGSSYYRKSIYPEYKGNREELRKNQSEAEAEAFTQFIEEFENCILAVDSHPRMCLLRYKGVEADDIAAYIVKYKEKFLIDNIWLVSSDKDWDLLIQQDVSRFSYVTRGEITESSWPYSVTPTQLTSVKVIMGDAGDNIKGVPGIGPTRAEKLIQEYGNILDLMDSLPISSKYKYIQSLNDFGSDKLLTNLELVDLLTFCETAISEDNCRDIDFILQAYMDN